MIGETIIVTRRGSLAGGDDEQGNPIVGPPTTFAIAAVAPAPGTREEQQELYGPRSENAFTLYRRGDMDLRADDLVELRGMPGWQVVADASSADWVSPYAAAHVGSVAEIRRAS